ncbi:MAG: hypothetical protein JXA71_09685 [Chitinispirillaceae bacterium]|nr:hypothetical protein [Chitinispirillaceae bacterium]
MKGNLPFNGLPRQGISPQSRHKDLIYLVSAINGAGKYRIYMMNADGSDNRDITPSYFPPGFLCYASIFSNDDSRIYFIGMWY